MMLGFRVPLPGGSLPVELPRTTRIGITGLANSGKTVFLTSLLWQLCEFDDADFRLGGNLRISGWREVGASPSRSDLFDFEKHRDALARRQSWPEKTRDTSRFTCEFTRSDWRFFRQRLEFFDFPGERVADASIAACRDYAEWSEHMLRHWRSHSGYEAATRPFLEACRDRAIGEEALLLEYRRTLARLILEYKPLISPSVFLLDRKGSQAEGDFERLAAERCSGLPGEEFCPLPLPARDRFPEMARRYRAYRHGVVMPLFRELLRCDRLIALIDIPSLLAGGVGRYNDDRQIVLDLVRVLQPASTLGGRLIELLQMRARLRRLAFVATKADLVHPEDLRNERMTALLRHMTNKARGMLPDVEMGWFACAVCRSTREGSRPDTLVGRLVRDGDGREQEYAVSRLPEAWPDDWPPGAYRFPVVWPETSRNIQLPPQQQNLDRVFDFILR